MSAVVPDEIRAGLVVRLDPAVLRADPGCTTNAELVNGEDRSVRDEHYFLLLHVDPVDGAALSVPLFSRPAPGSEELKENLKSGEPAGWIGVTSHYSRWQHWWVPAEHLSRASVVDDTTPLTRRFYAVDDKDELMRIADWRNENRAPWRAL